MNDSELDDGYFGPMFEELERLLAERKPNGDHPPPQTLLQYAQRALDESLLSVVSLHVLTCSSCQDTVARVRREEVQQRERQPWPWGNPPEGIIASVAGLRRRAAISVGLSLFVIALSFFVPLPGDVADASTIGGGSKTALLM